jgi:hypothetical protein
MTTAFGSGERGSSSMQARQAVWAAYAAALVRSREQRMYRKLLCVSSWVLGVGICLYDGLDLVSEVLHVAGV